MRCREDSLRFFLWRRRPALASPRTLPFYLFHPLPDPLFNALTRRPVVHAIAQIIGKALQVGNLAFEVVGILVSLPVSKPLHQAGGSVAQVQGDRIRRGLFYVL